MTPKYFISTMIFKKNILDIVVETALLSSRNLLNSNKLFSRDRSLIVSLINHTYF